MLQSARAQQQNALAPVLVLTIGPDIVIPLLDHGEPDGSDDVPVFFSVYHFGLINTPSQVLNHAILLPD